MNPGLLPRLLGPFLTQPLPCSLINWVFSFPAFFTIDVAGRRALLLFTLPFLSVRRLARLRPASFDSPDFLPLSLLADVLDLHSSSCSSQAPASTSAQTRASSPW